MHFLFIKKPAAAIMMIDQSYASVENDSICERDIHGVCSKRLMCSHTGLSALLIGINSSISTKTRLFMTSVDCSIQSVPLKVVRDHRHKTENS